MQELLEEVRKELQKVKDEIIGGKRANMLEMHLNSCNSGLIMMVFLVSASEKIPGVDLTEKP